MTDITKCSNDKCPSKDDCYRFTAYERAQQSYAEFDFGGGICCEDYIPNGRGSDRLRELFYGKAKK